MNNTSDTLLASLVQFRNDEAAVGVGFFVTDCLVVTCAHVINEAQGLDHNWKDEPTSVVSFWGTESQKFTGKVIGWLPMIEGDDGLGGDIAILEVQGRSNKKGVALWDDAGIEGKSFASYGFPLDSRRQGRSSRGVVGLATFSGRRELLQAASAALLDLPVAGFSGAPVLVDGTVVGMIAATHTKSVAGSGIAYMIPLLLIAKALPSSDALSSRISHRSDPAFAHVDRLLVHLERFSKKPLSNVEFELRLRKANEFSDISRIALDDDERIYRDTDLLPEDLVVGEPQPPIVLLAPGGSGKSTFLARVIRAARANNVSTYLLDLSETNRIKIEPASETVPKDFGDFFERFRAYSDYQNLTQQIKDRKDVLLVIDGLNERPASPDGSDFAAIEDFCRVNPSVRVIVADRVRSRSMTVVYDLATIVPIPKEEVLSVLGSTGLSDQTQQLLASPFFLDLYLSILSAGGGTGERTRIQMFEEYFSRHVGIDAILLKSLAQLAWEAFRSGAGPTLSKTAWEELARQQHLPDGILARLISSGALVSRGSSEEMLQFRHQLLHDFLNARSLVNEGPRAWQPVNFDICTLNAASHEVIELAAEILGNLSDQLLRQVYDWNYGAVLDCVRNLETKKHGGEYGVPPEFRDAVYVLNAEKAFDRFAHTAKRARSSLKAIGKTLEVDGDIATLDALVDAVRNYCPTTHQTDSWLSWQKLYAKCTPVTVQDLELLWAEPVTGWTAANVYRRSPLSNELCVIVRAVYHALVATDNDLGRTVGARWRIAHVLGVSIKEEDRSLLLQIVQNRKEDKWVRYGAVRSLAESLSLTFDEAGRGTRTHYLERLADALPTIHDWQVRNEIRRVSLLSDWVLGAETWYADYLPVLQAGLKCADTFGEKEKEEWSTAIKRVEEMLERKSRETGVTSND